MTVTVGLLALATLALSTEHNPSKLTRISLMYVGKNIVKLTMTVTVGLAYY
jgi:hypothetical protein